MSEKERNEENISEEENIKDQVEEILDDAIEEADEKSAEAEGEQLSEKDQLKADLEKEKDKFLRLFAEFENYKRRTSKERIEMFKTASQDVIIAMLPVLDDFDRALNEIAKAKDKNLLKGVELIHTKFRETLRAKGLELMEVKEGDSFDADLHEAITQIPAPSDKLKGKIVDVVEKGYKLGDKIIRYPKVVTGK
ncbi:molecular chaperone GrpE [Salinimicrobium catena]|uniref:Protein GrpE n=1 Tax=Salinimicrobium catena TaxID=390640 RepID=A0A1H5NF37_9FLAO|nr:nucleotide exchange factor GrpE [Salinimicrobium catena]SDL43348.1 molecular chaperone GrpE [Salinimicrobium catena]SEE99481.1 molecular chaperone GrpE [Salinimicrobium catena]